MYEELLDARESENESTKDIYRKIAPLYQQLEDYQKAANCLQKVIDQEDQQMIKVGLLTKMAGNYKKLNNMEQCVKASVDAFVLIQKVVGPEDAQTCRCLVNLGTVYQYFERNDDAKDKYRQYINMFE